jgi:hypothetical protein
MGALLGVDGRQLDARVLMLGCCRGRTEEFTSVIARHLGGPTAFVGCTGQPRTSEGPIVFPPLLIAAAPLVAAGATPSEMEAVIGAELDKLVTGHSKGSYLQESGWGVRTLFPEG